MSASSVCVTCGMLSQARCRCGPERRFRRDRGLVSIGPNLAKSCAGIPEYRPGARRTAPAERALDVVLGDAALFARAFDARQIDIELARQGGAPTGSRARRRNRIRAAAVHAPCTPASPPRGRRRGRRGGCVRAVWAVGLLIGRWSSRFWMCSRRHLKNGRTLAHLVADLDQDLRDLSGLGRRYVHRRLVALERDQGIVALHRYRPASRAPR